MSNSYSAPQDSTKRKVYDLRDLVLQEVQLPLAAFLALVPKKLIEYNDKPGATESTADFVNACRVFSSHHTVIASNFYEQIRSVFDKFANEPRPDNPDDWHESTLSLVSHEEMEEDVALNAIRSRTENEYSHQLWGLGQRISLLTGGKRLPEHKLPISPSVFCQALRQAIDCYNLSLEVRLIIFKLFEKSFIKALGAIYNQLNLYLKEMGILPNLRYSVTKDERSKGRTARRIATLDNETVRSLLGQLDGTGSAGSSTPQHSSTRTGYNEAQLVEATRQLQQVSVAAFKDTAPVSAIQPVDIHRAREELLNHLQQVTGSASRPSLSSDDMKAIELVGMLFEYMLNDEQLPDVVKALLSHLHTPFIKIALANRDFFEQEAHPARLLMNNLADAGVKWVGNDGKGQYGVVETIRSTVRQVVDEFDKDSRLFAKLLVEFSSYIKKVEIKVQLLEKRAAEKARGEDRLKQVKQRVNQEIKKRIADVELPSALLLLFLQPWSDYLAFLLLRYGDKSEHWHQALSLIDDLLWGLELEDTPENRTTWRQNYTWVEATLAKGFETIGYNPGKAARLKSAIDKIYEFSYRSQRTSTPQELRQKLIHLADQRVGKPVDRSNLEAPEQHLIEELTALNFGTWFEYKDGRREKLAWFNKSSLQFLFVDQSGRRTGMKDGAALARQMLAGELRAINTSDQPLVERTLKSIFTDLSSQVSSVGN